MTNRLHHFTTATYMPDGTVKLDLWLAGKEDPVDLRMTPGEAMNLCAQLADAAQHALQASVK